MGTKIWKKLVNYMYDEAGNVSLTGDAGARSPGGDGASDPGVPADAGVPALGTDATTDPTLGVLPPEIDFPDGLDDEIKGDPSLKVFVKDGKLNYANVLKSYVHAQKRMGERGVNLPNEKSSDEDWAQFYNALRPSDLAEYEIQNSLGDNQALDEQMFNGFKETAHQAGLAPKQAQQLLDWYNSNTSEAQKMAAGAQQEAYQAEVQGLKADWGEKFDSEVSLAKRALSEFADEGMVKALQDSGLDGNVTLIKLLNKIGHGMMEDKFDKESHGSFGMTKDEAERKIASIYGDPKHAYFHKDHASHRHAVDEMNKLVEASIRE